MTLKTITAAAEVVLIGQTNLTTTWTLCTCRDNVCWHWINISYAHGCELLFCCFLSVQCMSHLLQIQLCSYTSLNTFQQHPNNSTRVLHPYVREERATYCSDSNGNNSFTENVIQFVAVLRNVVLYTSCCQWRNSASASAMLDSPMCHYKWRLVNLFLRGHMFFCFFVLFCLFFGGDRVTNK